MISYLFFFFFFNIDLDYIMNISMTIIIILFIIFCDILRRDLSRFGGGGVIRTRVLNLW